jgi:hypothetical protein
VGGTKPGESGIAAPVCGDLGTGDSDGGELSKNSGAVARVLTVRGAPMVAVAAYSTMSAADLFCPMWTSLGRSRTHRNGIAGDSGVLLTARCTTLVTPVLNGRLTSNGRIAE